MSLVSETGTGLDTVKYEAERIESLTGRVDALADGRFSAVLVYDSVGIRKRSVGGRWRDLAASERELAPARVVFTDRFEVLAPEFIDVPHRDAAVSEVMRGASAGIHCALPERATSVGDSWNVDLAYALTPLSALAKDENVSLVRELRSSAVARLDSVVINSVDTLAYIFLNGRFEEESTDSIVSVSGGFVSTLIWSVGWQTYASAATNAEITLVYGTHGYERVSASSLRFDIITQTQVRM